MTGRKLCLEKAANLPLIAANWPVRQRQNAGEPPPQYYTDIIPAFCMVYFLAVYLAYVSRGMAICQPYVSCMWAICGPYICRMSAIPNLPICLHNYLYSYILCISGPSKISIQRPHIRAKQPFANIPCTYFNTY